MNDSSEQAREHAALLASEGRLRAIVQGMPVLMDVDDEQGLIVAWNSECERTTGYSAIEMIGIPCAMEMLYPYAKYRNAMQAEAVRRRRAEYSSICELTAKDGSLRWIEWFNFDARPTIPGRLEWSIGIDITERRRLEDALRDATLREKRRLGRELHDELGQELTGLAMLAASLARSPAVTDAALAGELEQLSAIASRAIATCKNIARGLAPVTDAQRGLSDALRGLTADLVRQNSGLAITYTEDNAAPLAISLEACNQLFRIAREALANSVAHAFVRKLRVQLIVGPERVCVELSDDGRGIPADSAQGGIGLQTMRDRARAIRARMTITAAANGGTVVRCECANLDRGLPAKR